jgi:hypothetical protein
MVHLVRPGRLGPVVPVVAGTTVGRAVVAMMSRAVVAMVSRPVVTMVPGPVVTMVGTMVVTAGSVRPASGEKE